MALGLLKGTKIKTTRLPPELFYRDIGFAWRKGHSRIATLERLMDVLPIPESALSAETD
jgi:hypothetical protein